MTSLTELPELTDDLIRRLDVPGPRYTSYPTAPEWSPDLTGEQYLAKIGEAGRVAPDEPLSLYIHIPFCRELCTYCGCNVVISKDDSRADPYIEAVAKEMELVAAHLGPRRRLSQLHWGGGTPTFLNERQLGYLWSRIRSLFEPQPDAEVAIEVDPAITTRGQLDLLRSLGFNRLSMGVQDFDPDVQAAVNRIQSVEETRDLLVHARSLGFTGINFDLIYGLPRQTPASWQRTLELVTELHPDRMAVYSFAFIPDLRHHQRKIDADEVPKGTDKLNLFRQTYKTFTEAGYRAIGMDHFAVPEDELSRAQRERRLGRNFQGYTVKSAMDVVAFGVTGISDVQGCYAQNVRPLKLYYDAIAAGQPATERGILLTEEDRVRRALITQLMCNFWLDLADFGGVGRFEPEMERLRHLESEGLVVLDGSQVDVTPLGRLFVRVVAMTFDTFLRRRTGTPGFSRTV
ncbi:MAG: oxygen-independent coproporphyrinogen III oxidase [Myxococcales bacterium]